MTPLRSNSEIAQMQRAGSLLRDCFLRLAKNLRAGTEAAQLRRIADEFIVQNGGRWSPPLTSSLLLAVNDRLLGPAENRRLEAGDLVTLDLSVSLDGWWADCAIVLPVGKITLSDGRLIRAARALLLQSIESLGDRVSWNAIVRECHKFAESNQLHVVESLCGHGIGKELHESPRLSWKQEDGSEPLFLQSGMTITMEPALSPGSGALIPTPGGGHTTSDGLPVVWFEETVEVTGTGCRLLTQVPGLAEERNVVLIGMPGTGKSTVGRALGAMLGRPFVDLDALIESQHGRRLEEIIHAVGFEEFLDLEAQAAIDYDRRGTVLATGGSVVYRPEAMLALQQAGTVVFLHTPLAELEHRLSDLKQRGVVVEENQSLADLFEHREPLYECYHDLKIETAGHTVAETVAAITSHLKLNPP